METRPRWLRRDNARHQTQLRRQRKAGNRVGLVVAKRHLLEPCTYGRERLVTAAFQLRLNCLELGHQPFLGRRTPVD